MKKITSTLAMILLLAFATTMVAQESQTDDTSSSPTTKGTFLISARSDGGLNFSSNYVEVDGDESDKDKNTSFSLSPSAGIFVADNFAVGAQLSYSSSTFKPSDESRSDFSQSTFSAGPFARFYFHTGMVKPYVGGAILFGSTSRDITSFDLTDSDPIISTTKNTTTSTTWGVNGGVSVFLNSSIAIDIDLGYSKSTSQNKDSGDFKVKNGNLGLNFGFSLFL